MNKTTAVYLDCDELMDLITARFGRMDCIPRVRLTYLSDASTEKKTAAFSLTSITELRLELDIEEIPLLKSEEEA